VRAMRGAAVLISLVLSFTACKKEASSSDVNIDLRRASAEIETRMANLWNRPLVAKATDQFFDSLGNNAPLKAKGMALLDTLQADPQISGPVSKLMAELTSDPSIQKTVMELMAQHPGASPDEIGTMVGDRFAAAWASPEVSMAWSKAWDGLLRRIGGDSDLSGIEHSVFARFEAKYNDSAVLEKWNKRIGELAAGQSRDKATDLFLEKFFSQDRIEAIVADVLNNPTFRSESAAALGKLLTLDSVSKDARAGAAEMLADPIVHDAAVTLMKQLTTAHPDGATVSHALDSLLAAPSVVKTVKRIIHTASTDPQVAAVGNTWMDKLGQDAGLKADFDKFIYGW
jgi:hypothetical protein